MIVVEGFKVRVGCRSSVIWIALIEAHIIQRVGLTEHVVRETFFELFEDCEGVVVEGNDAH